MIEREIKLSAWPAFTLPDLDGVADGARTARRETIDLDATYFDTPDLRLGRRGITLRHRRRGPRETWTLKLPAGASGLEGGLARDEIDVSAPAGDIPERLALLVAGHVRTQSLRKVARLMTVRRRTLVKDAEGMVLAEIDDDEVSVMAGGRVAARFREIEVEIAPDAEAEVAEAVIDRLRRAGAGPGGTLPKVARAVGPGFLEPPEGDVTPLPDDPTAADVIALAVRSSVARLLDHHAMAILGDDPEGVHQMRVATRRLRSDLRTFRPLLDRDVTDPLRRELKWLGEILGGVRDADVLTPRIADGATRTLEASDAPAVATVLDRLAADRGAAVVVLHESLGSDRYRRLLDALVALAVAPPVRRSASAPAVDVLPDLVARPWRHLRKAVGSSGDQPSGEELHEVRKRAKAARYAAEAVEPAIGKPARRAAKGAKAVQSVLGDHQDTVVAEEWFRSTMAAPGVAVSAAFVLGALTADERAERAELRSAWPAAWHKASQPKRWSWLP